MEKPIYHTLLTKKASKQKMVALLVDPDKVNESNYAETVKRAVDAQIDLILVGGSLLTDGDIDETVKCIKKETDIPVVLFPVVPS